MTATSTQPMPRSWPGFWGLPRGACQSPRSPIGFGSTAKSSSKPARIKSEGKQRVALIGYPDGHRVDIVNDDGLAERKSIRNVNPPAHRNPSVCRFGAAVDNRVISHHHPQSHDRSLRCRERLILLGNDDLEILLIRHIEGHRKDQTIVLDMGNQMRIPPIGLGAHGERALRDWLRLLQQKTGREKDECGRLHIYTPLTVPSGRRSEQ